MRLCPPSSRPALSLFEVLIATGVFLLSTIGLGHLVSTASKVASAANHRSQAGLLARSKLAEIEAGAVPLTSATDSSFDENPDYTWSLDAQQRQFQSQSQGQQQQSPVMLWNVTLRVKHKNDPNSEWAISRMMLDPSCIGQTQDVIPVTQSPTSAAAQASSGSGSGSGSSTPPSSTPASSPSPLPTPSTSDPDDGMGGGGGFNKGSGGGPKPTGGTTGNGPKPTGGTTGGTTGNSPKPTGGTPK